jgi:hypothetical protein
MKNKWIINKIRTNIIKNKPNIKINQELIILIIFWVSHFSIAELIDFS